ncbi:hypothetical protein [Pedobacter sp.]|uniref:hypothetical protein n=1 Tax=Pedobacter sp. TaxID=1411316 RepID=UPI003BA856A0
MLTSYNFKAKSLPLLLGFGLLLLGFYTFKEAYEDNKKLDRRFSFGLVFMLAGLIIIVSVFLGKI